MKEESFQYAKSALDNLSADVLKRLKKEIEHAND
jgi:hypothetical protein